MRLFNEIAKRGAAILLLAATAFAAITYSLGLYEVSFIDRKEEEYDDDMMQGILGTLPPGTNISDFTGDISDITQTPSTSSPSVSPDAPVTSSEAADTAPESSASDTTESGGDDPIIPSGPNTLAEFLAEGYKIT